MGVAEAEMLVRLSAAKKVLVLADRFVSGQVIKTHTSWRPPNGLGLPSMVQLEQTGWFYLLASPITLAPTSPCPFPFGAF